MSVATARPRPWVVDDLYSFPEDGMRYELLDETLLVSPPPSVHHQRAARRLVEQVSAAAPAEVEVLEAVGVALPAGLLVPDVVVAWTTAVDIAQRELAATDVLAVVEIVSRSSRVNDRRWKPAAYAEAGIAVYVRVELAGPGGEPEVVVYALEDGGYVETAAARGSRPAVLAVPFELTITATDLVGPPRR